MVKENYGKMFIDNFNGKTPETKNLGSDIKTKGTASYLPWALMHRLLTMQDPEFTFEVVKKSYGAGSSGGAIVWTDEVHIQSKVVKDDVIQSESFVTVFNHMVVVRVTFLGKVLEECYPIQEQQKGKGFVAPKVINANVANKSLKRAFAKAASLVSGIGLSLYETGDLQFEDDDDAAPTVKPEKKAPVKKPVRKEVKESTKAEKPVKTEPKTSGEEGMTDTITAEISAKGSVTESSEDVAINVAEKIHGNAAINKGLQKTNTTTMKKYGFTISTEEPVVDLIDKLRNFKDAAVFYSVLVKQSK